MTTIDLQSSLHGRHHGRNGSNTILRGAGRSTHQGAGPDTLQRNGPHSYRTLAMMNDRARGHDRGHPAGELPALIPRSPFQAIANGHQVPQFDAASSQRPSSAPGNKQAPGVSFTNGAVSEDGDDEPGPSKPIKPPLLRSKSEHGLRHGEPDDEVNEEFYEWGARHGFEDHYQSEDIISQLANVSCASLLGPFWCAATDNCRTGTCTLRISDTRQPRSPSRPRSRSKIGA